VLKRPPMVLADREMNGLPVAVQWRRRSGDAELLECEMAVRNHRQRHASGRRWYGGVWGSTIRTIGDAVEGNGEIEWMFRVLLGACGHWMGEQATPQFSNCDQPGKEASQCYGCGMYSSAEPEEIAALVLACTVLTCGRAS
jgi:hypothetical protein